MIKEFEELLYEGYVCNKYKHMSTDSYFYIARHFEKCMMRFNMRVGIVRTKMTNTQTMNDYEIITQNIPNSYVCYLDASE